MKIKRTLLFILLILSITANSQWKKSSNNDVFDGNYRVAMVVGEGGKFPYTKPILVVNYFEKSDDLNVYVSNTGYSGCSDKVIYFKFDSDDTIYRSTSIGTNANKEAWFIKTGNLNLPSNLNFLDNHIQLLEKLKTHSKLDIRMMSSCSKADYQFNLSGSTSAINYVLELRKKGDKKREKLIKEKLIQKSIKDSIEKSQKRIKDSIEKRRGDSIYNSGVDFIKKAERKSLLRKRRNDSLLKLRYGSLIDKYPLNDFNYLSTKFGYTRFFKNKELTKSAKTVTSQGTLVLVKKNDNNKEDYYQVVFIKGVGEVQYYVMKDYLK